MSTIRIGDVYRFNKSGNEFTIESVNSTTKTCKVRYTKVLSKHDTAIDFNFQFEHIMSTCRLVRVGYELDEKFKGL